VPKTTNHTKLKRRSPSLVSDFYKHLFTNMTVPVTTSFIARLSEDLLKWAVNDDNALKLTQFTRKVGVHSGTFYRWANKHPTLRNALTAAKEAIGDRREIGALTGKYNYKMVMHQQHHYDNSWWDSEVKRAELRARTTDKLNPDIKYVIAVEDFSKKVKTPTKNLPVEK